ncbi:MAG: hypothetical protein KKD73_08700 [Proteobacteria bacterium]|nr:hypothetical protein [Pseudomonadota bacterium]MBU1640520.1 hypothetical protein [Pseudomonadota bacterium]
MKHLHTTGLTFLIALFLSLNLSGCIFGLGSSDESLEVAPAVETNQPFYHYSYRQILLPFGLELDKKESLFVDTDSFTGGHLRYFGQLEIESLAEFFINTMPKNKWKKVYSSVSGRMLQAYSREGRTCIIKITETNFKTYVDIYVSDIVGNSTSDPLN